MRLPPGLDSDAHTAAELLPRLFESLSPDTLVPVIDVETQSEREPMSLGAAARHCFLTRWLTRLVLPCSRFRGVLHDDSASVIA